MNGGRTALHGGVLLLLAAGAVALLIGVPLALTLIERATSRPAGVAWEEQAVTLPVWSRDGYFDSGSALSQIRSSGATSVTLVVTWYAPNATSPEILRTGRTASDAALTWAVKEARASGLDVTLKPHIDSEDGKWRAYLNPADADRWFEAYAALITHYAEMAQRLDVVMLSVGAELISMSTNPAYEHHWRALIAAVRESYTGKLTYSANWGGGYDADESFAEEATRIPFWDALDYLGISAYFELAQQDSPTVADLKQSWTRWRREVIEPLHRRWRRPVLFTEVGYRSADGAAQRPWASDAQLPLDLQEQVDCWEAFFASWAKVPWFAGASLWMWTTNDHANAADTGYSIQGKPAHATVSRWFGAPANPAPVEGSSRTPRREPVAATTRGAMRSARWW